MTRVTIIGGGVAGLACAALLAHTGYEVDLFEQGDQLGGRAGVWHRDGFRFDTGPSWYLMSEVFDHFFALLGTSTAAQLQLRRLDPAYRVFFEHDDGPLDVRSDPVKNVESFEAIEPGAGAALEKYLASAGETYDMAMRRFLYTWFGSPRSLVHSDTLRSATRLPGLLARSLESFVAGRFTDRRLRQVLGYPAVFLGTSPERAPSMYHLMSALDLTGGVLYPEGGMRAVVDALVRCAEEAGARLHTGTAVTRIRTTGTRRARRVTGVEVDRTDHAAAESAPGEAADFQRAQVDPAGAGRQGRRSGGGGDGTAREQVPADIVVGAGDVHHIETRLLDADARSLGPRYWAKRSPGPGGVLAMLGVRGRLPQLAHHSLFFTADWRANFDAIFGSAPQVPDPASVYVCTASRSDPSCAPEGMENVFVLVPVPADPSIGRGGLDGTGSPQVEQAVDAAIDMVADWAGIEDLPERIVTRRTVGPGDFADDLNAWSGSMLGPGHTLGQSAFLRTPNASGRVRGLYYAGASTVPGVGVPMCLISAEVLLKRLRNDRSTGPMAAPL